MPIRSVGPLVLAGWLLAGCAEPQGAANAVTDAQAAAIRGDPFKPAGSGRYPAIVVLHGCGGVSERERAWARKLTQWGYVALVTDSFKPRGHGSICGAPQTVNAQTRTGDVVRAVRWLNEQPFVQPGRIGLVGFSHGGSTTLSAAQDGAGLVPLGVKAAVAFYPGCSRTRYAAIAFPVLVMIGDKDDWTLASWCRGLERGLASDRRQLAEFVYYPNAYHGFDRQLPTRWVDGMRDGVVAPRRLEYDPDAARDADERTKAWLAKWLTAGQ